MTSTVVDSEVLDSGISGLMLVSSSILTIPYSGKPWECSTVYRSLPAAAFASSRLHPAQFGKVNRCTPRLALSVGAGA